MSRASILYIASSSYLTDVCVRVCVCLCVCGWGGGARYVVRNFRVLFLVRANYIVTDDLNMEYRGGRIIKWQLHIPKRCVIYVANTSLELRPRFSRYFFGFLHLLLI